MEGQTAQECSRYLSLAKSGLKLGLSKEEVNEIAQSPSLPAFDEKDEAIYEGALSYSNSHEINFYLCCSHVLELYLQENVTKQDVEKHLSKKLEQVSEYFQKKELPRNYQTILLLGGSGEGKSLLTNHLTGRIDAIVGNDARSQTLAAQVYISEKCNLNIVDTEGLDGTSQNIGNEELMENLLLKIVYCLELGTSIDAIILMWCPIKRGKSSLEKTVKIVKETFGEEALKSCIFMIQGNWVAAAEICDLGEAVPKEKETLQKDFPNVPIIEYDAKGSVDEQISILKTAIGKVQPYKKEYFEKKRKEEFSNMVRVFKAKMQKELAQNHSNEGKEEAKKNLISTVESVAVKLMQSQGDFLKTIKSAWDEIFTAENTKLILKKSAEIALGVVALFITELIKRPPV